METIEKYGENLFDEFKIKIENIKGSLTNVYGKKIKLVNFSHSPNIKMSTNIGNYNIEVNCWHVYNDLEKVGKIISVFDKFGDYYCIEISN